MNINCTKLGRDISDSKDCFKSQHLQHKAIYENYLYSKANKRRPMDTDENVDFKPRMINCLTFLAKLSTSLQFVPNYYVNTFFLL